MHMNLTANDVYAARLELAKRGKFLLPELPPKLRPVFEGKSRYRGAYGGRGSGKTRGFAKMAAVMGDVWATSGKTGVILCAREFQNSLEDSSFSEIATAIESDPYLCTRWQIGQQYIRHVTRKVEFIFRGLRHNTQSLKGIARILLTWADEAEQISEQSWAILIPTVREDDSEIWVTYNPESEKSATHLRFRANATPAMKMVEMNWRDNPWFPDVLSQERITDLEARPDDYEHIWEGGFRTNVQGAYYSANINQARNEGRITSVPHDPALPVKTYWDLGLDDSTAVWFAQEIGKEIRLIEYAEWTQIPLMQIAGEVMARSYTYADHILPHDVRVREMTTGRSREEVLRSLLGRLTVAPMLTIDDGINAVRVLFSRFWFDEKKCAAGLDALRNYAKRWDDKRKTFENKPHHDWSSHGSDAMRMLAVSYRERIERKDERVRKTAKRSAWAA